MEFTPNIFQQEALIELSNTKKDKGVVIMPTGTGKTFLASLWFKKQLEENPQAKLLFICHNKDILSQANEREFQIHLKDFKISYGYYNAIEKDVEQVTFATTQTLARNLDKFPKDHFDYVIVDECHHYQARTFKKVIEYFKPKFMLGLTATPNRMDMKNIFTLLGEPIYTAKIFEAIKKGLLSKINYYAVDNDIDFSDIEWNGYKYSEEDLNKKLCVKKYDEAILKEYEQHIKNKRKKTICFCASVEHCYRMEDLFKKNGIKAVALTGKYSYKGIRRTIHHKKRTEIIKDFRSDGYDIVFVRDLFNEGVDIPIADCVMMLRPTLSSTIYTQQIGRGLRKHKDKKDLLLLDFTGNANKSELNMDSMSDMLGRDIVEEIKKKLKKPNKNEQIMIVTEGGRIRLNKTKLKFFKNYFSKFIRPSKEEIVELYNNRMSVKDIAKKFNCSNTYICIILREQGVDKSSKINILRKKLRDYTEEIVKCYLDGMSVVCLSKKYGTTRYMMTSFLKKMGTRHNFEKSQKELWRVTEKNIISDYKLGLAQVVIAKKHQVSRAKVVFILKKEKVFREQGVIAGEKQKILIKHKEEIVELYNNGMSQTDISKKFKRSCTCIGKLLREWGVDTSYKLKLTLSKEEIVELYNNRMSVKDIAKKFNCSNTYIWRILREQREKGVNNDRK